MLRLTCVIAAVSGSAFAEDKLPAFLHKGDSVEVAVNNSPLKVGTQIRARLTSGEQVTIKEVKGKWAWTTVSRFGREVQGWVILRHVRPTAATWKRMKARVGRNEAKQVTFLDLGETKVTDADLACLRNLPQLKDLILNGKSITDAGLDHLKQVSKLEVLVLTGTGITDKAVPHLGEMRKLQTLVIEKTEVTDDGVKELQKLLPNTLVQR